MVDRAVVCLGVAFVCALVAPAVAQKSCVRWLEVPGQYIETADLVVSPDVDVVWVNNRPFGVDRLGYVNVPVHPGLNVASVRGRSVTLDVAGPPAAILEAVDQAEFDAAIQSLPDGGVVRLTGPGPYRFERWLDLGNGNDWIRIEGSGQTIIGENLGTIRYKANRLCWVGLHFDIASIGQFHPDPGDSLAFIDCTFDGKVGDRWLRAGNALGEGQMYYFKGCAVISDTSHGFTDSQLVDRCTIARCDGDTFQSSYAVTRSSVFEFFETYVPGNPTHHKDNWQFFIRRREPDHVGCPGSADGGRACRRSSGRTTSWSTPASRTGAPVQLRDHYAWSSVTLRRVNAPIQQRSRSGPGRSRGRAQTQFWGRNGATFGSRTSCVDQIVNFRGGDVYSNRFQLLGHGQINGLICNNVGFDETTGSIPGTTEIPPGFVWDRVGITNPLSFNSAYYDVYEFAPYANAQEALGIVPPLSPDDPTPGPVLWYMRAADLTTQGAGEDDLGFGRADCLITAADLSMYIQEFLDAGPRADLTTLGAAQIDASFGVPDGQVTAADLQYYLAYYITNASATCPNPGEPSSEFDQLWP